VGSEILGLSDGRKKKERGQERECAQSARPTRAATVKSTLTIAPGVSTNRFACRVLTGLGARHSEAVRPETRPTFRAHHEGRAEVYLIVSDD